MRSRSRDIVAVILLLVLIAVGAFGAHCFIHSGDHWNRAASAVDTYLGELEGYAVVLLAKDESITQVGASFDESITQVEAPSDTTISQVEAPSDTTISQVGASSDATASEDKARAAQIASAVSGDGANTAQSDDSSLITWRSLAAAYKEKGATVFPFTMSSHTFFRQPVLKVRNNVRIAFIDVDSSTTAAQLALTQSKLDKLHADAVVAVVHNARLTLRNLPGIDVAIFERPLDIPGKGQRCTNTLWVSIPEDNAVQAVTIAPSGATAAKLWALGAADD